MLETQERLPQAFITACEFEINDNARRKGSWLEWKPSIARAGFELLQHAAKFQTAVAERHSTKAMEYAADVGAIAAKCWELAQDLTSPIVSNSSDYKEDRIASLIFQITTWQVKIFGLPENRTLERLINRVKLEVEELLTAAKEYDASPTPANLSAVENEIADVIILLLYVILRHSGDLFSILSRKFAVIQKRKYVNGKYWKNKRRNSNVSNRFV